MKCGKNKTKRIWQVWAIFLCVHVILLQRAKLDDFLFNILTIWPQSKSVISVFEFFIIHKQSWKEKLEVRKKILCLI